MVSSSCANRSTSNCSLGRARSSSFATSASPQLAVAHQRDAQDLLLFVQELVLAQHAEPHGPRDREHALIGLDVPAQDAQQRRLARAVRADQPVALGTPQAALAHGRFRRECLVSKQAQRDGRQPIPWRSDPAAAALPAPPYQPSTYAKIRGATIVASDSIMNFGVSTSSLPQVIFSLGTAPE